MLSSRVWWNGRGTVWCALKRERKPTEAGNTGSKETDCFWWVDSLYEWFESEYWPVRCDVLSRRMIVDNYFSEFLSNYPSLNNIGPNRLISLSQELTCEDVVCVQVFKRKWSDNNNIFFPLFIYLASIVCCSSIIFIKLMNKSNKGAFLKNKRFACKLEIL